MKIYEVLHKNKILMGDFEKDETARIYTRKKFKHLWLKKDGEKYYFKERLPRKELYIGDVVAPYIFERVGFKPDEYLMYYLVDMETPEGVKPGVLSKCYIGKHEFQLSYYDVALFGFCLDNGIEYANIKDDKILGLEHSSKIKRFEETFKENPGEYLVSAEDMLHNIKRFCGHFKFDVDLADIEFKLKRMLLADFFLCQVDRHRGNTEFKVKHNKFTMCPIFDHEHCLSVGLLGKAYNMTKFPIYTGFSSVGAQKNDYLQESQNLAKSGIMGASEFANSLKKNANFMDNSRLFRNNGLMACDVIAECLRDERLKKYAFNFMSLDINETLNQFEKDYMGIHIPIKKCMCDQFETMQEKFAVAFNIIDKHFSQSNKSNEKFKRMKKEFQQPIDKVNQRMARRNELLNKTSRQTQSTLDEDYLLGLLCN